MAVYMGISNSFPNLGLLASEVVASGPKIRVEMNASDAVRCVQAMSDQALTEESFGLLGDETQRAAQQQTQQQQQLKLG